MTLVRGAPMLDAARIGTSGDRRRARRPEPGKLHAAELAADALARALGAPSAPRRGVAAPPTAGADAGGDERRRRQRRRGPSVRGDGEAAAVTLELWADPENDAERSCCSASAVAQARALAHSMGLPHFTIDLRDEFRAGVVEPFIAGYARGETPNPCVGCNGHVRLDAMLELADRLGCAELATGHYARTAEPGDARRTAAARRRRSGQGPDLHAGGAGDPRRWRGCASRSASCASPRSARSPPRRGCRWRTRPTRQDLCFLAGTDRARFLARHGGIGDRPGELVDQGGTVLGEHVGQHRFTVGQRRGLGIVRAGRAAVRARQGREPATGSPSAREPRCATASVRVRAARLHRPGARVDGVKLRYRSRATARARRRATAAGRHRELTVELDEPVDGAAPGQLACLMDGELVVGWGTIAADAGRRSAPTGRSEPVRAYTQRPMTSDEIRRTFFEFFE